MRRQCTSYRQDYARTGGVDDDYSSVHQPDQDRQVPLPRPPIPLAPVRSGRDVEMPNESYRRPAREEHETTMSPRGYHSADVHGEFGLQARPARSDVEFVEIHGRARRFAHPEDPSQAASHVDRWMREEFDPPAPAPPSGYDDYSLPSDPRIDARMRTPPRHRSQAPSRDENTVPGWSSSSHSKQRLARTHQADALPAISELPRSRDHGPRSAHLYDPRDGFEEEDPPQAHRDVNQYSRYD
ncbi:hypothetical protein PUNSTDRAFT_141008 [Punctularia strigosozonata HHB-11173 SS5]|uniref:uncharacterized protein n=1 Tax=Punctularia strigosozonata (strain HHB-11173) TaxID=741275 RepID=UPI0004416E5C|nr:uncharacterized protein PUNSTDRAFT_141008 [Punctularia strigosozonata HHB-11173 SS5]EIN12189.1 hypothetical protein PUNSTDRAFT_141008 [Punctularia strigosozonata HHB-11173 SS5]